MASYIAFLRKEPRSDYSVSFPDLPGCVTAGKTLEEARRFAAEALALHLRGFAEDGASPPASSTLEQAVKHEDFAGSVPFLVDAPAAGVVRVNITLDPTLLRRIDERSETAGMTRSAYLAHAALQALEAGSHPRGMPARSAAKARRRRRQHP